MTDTILILDFGSQVTQLIARRVREAGVYSEIVPFSQGEAAFDRLRPKGIILSGGPASVYWSEAPRVPKRLLTAQRRVRAGGYRHRRRLRAFRRCLEEGRA